MPNGGDCIELVHEQSYLGQSVNNIYYFEAIDGNASLVSLADWFETNVVAAVKQLQNTDLRHENLRLRNLFQTAENYEAVLTGFGAVTSGTIEMPAFFAAQIRFEHLTATTRPGFKRFSGLTEGDIADARMMSATITKLNTIGALLVNPPSVANVGWAHVVVNRVCDELNPIMGATPRCLRYVLPRSQAEYNPGYPVVYESYSEPTTQNTRKWYT
jgi:hypothetical protein